MSFVELEVPGVSRKVYAHKDNIVQVDEIPPADWAYEDEPQCAIWYVGGRGQNIKGHAKDIARLLSMVD
jgi:hypothetical protein